jgi:hypothetical protein
MKKFFIVGNIRELKINEHKILVTVNSFLLNLVKNQEYFMQSNCLIVRVWTSTENKDYPGEGVGHVSLETKDSYLSLWPTAFTPEQKEAYQQASPTQRKTLKYFMERDPSFHQDYKTDVEAEGGTPPQVTVCLYSLDTDMIENEFEKLKRDTTSWRLIGSNLFVQKIESTAQAITANSKLFESKVGKHTVDNCASLALKLLKAGGISGLIDTPTYSSVSTQTSSVVKPDNILKVIFPAKLTELEKYPDTEKLSFFGETVIEKPAKTTCLIL